MSADWVEIERLAGREVATWALWFQVAASVLALFVVSGAAWVGLHRRRLGNALLVVTLCATGWLLPGLFFDRFEIDGQGLRQKTWHGYEGHVRFVSLSGYSSILWAREPDGGEVLLLLRGPFRGSSQSGEEVARFPLGGVLNEAVVERVLARAKESGIAVLDRR